MKTEQPQRRKLSLNREAKQVGPVVEERLQKVLAQAGLGSRRVIEERIVAGEIRVNGNVAEIGSSLRNGDRVELDGKAFLAIPTPAEEIQALVYHKPEGELTTTEDPEGRRTVFERLPRLKGSRWIAIGRLDMNTTGLLLLTTDGELAHAMMHPSRELEREYVCRIHGQVTEDHLEQLRKSVMLEDGPAHFDEIHVISMGDNHSWFRVVLKEGRNREVRRMWESLGMQVARLKRIRYGLIELPRELRRGHYRLLEVEQIQSLRESCGLGNLPDTLTLQGVIGVRKATKAANEYRPDKPRGAGWSSGTADEARELRAFDRVRDDDARPGQRKRPGGPGGKGRKPGGSKPGGYAGKAGGGYAGPGRRGPAPGQALEASNFLTYYPGQEGMDGNRAPTGNGPRPPGGGARPGGGKPPGARGRSNRAPATFTGPMDSNNYINAAAPPPPVRRGPPRGPRGPR
ncbi:MAG: pseudouridine synthase [Pseudomonadota bacterium]|nr:pseudouridine synthase [Pseudomonadota bacterium]